jgi:hypothetical protein
MLIRISSQCLRERLTWRPAGATVVALALASGCGQGNGLETVPVHGKITFARGPCPKEGSISFTPVSVEEGLPRRPGRARFDVEGVFDVTSFRDGDGLIPGKYVAIVTCLKGQPSYSDPNSYEKLSYVPADYRPEIVVEKGASSQEVSLDVPKKK